MNFDDDLFKKLAEGKINISVCDCTKIPYKFDVRSYNELLRLAKIGTEAEKACLICLKTAHSPDGGECDGIGNLEICADGMVCKLVKEGENGE